MNHSRLALSLLSPETLSLLSKLSIFLFNVHLALFVRRMTQVRSLNSIGMYRHLVNTMELAWKKYCKSTLPSPGRPDDKQNHCRTGEECECEQFHLRRGSPLACGVMCFVSSSFNKHRLCCIRNVWPLVLTLS